MDPTAGIVSAAAEVLDAPTADLARARLADALREGTGAEVVSRVRLTTDSAAFFVDRDAPAPGSLPTPRDLALHPLLRFHRHCHSTAPATMDDAVRSGFQLASDTMAIIERLGLSINQLSVPTAPMTRPAPYTGWVAISSERFPPRVAELMTLFQPLIRALDSHVAGLDGVAEAPDGPPLTPRERVILQLLADGLTAHAIATRLAISERTVHKHLEHLYRKLGATDRLSAVMRAQGRGWLRRPSSTDQASSAAHSSRYPSSVTVSSSKSSSSR